MATFTKDDYNNIMAKLNTNQGLPPKINPSAGGLPNALPRPSGIKSHTKAKGGGTKMVVDPAKQAVAAIAGRGKARTPQIVSPTGKFALGKGPQLTNSQTAVGDVGLKTSQGLNAMTAWGNTLGGMPTPAPNQSLVPDFMQGVEGGPTPTGLAISTTGGREQYIPVSGNAIEGAKPYDASLVGTAPPVMNPIPKTGSVEPGFEDFAAGKRFLPDTKRGYMGEVGTEDNPNVGGISNREVLTRLVSNINAGNVAETSVNRVPVSAQAAMQVQGQGQPQGQQDVGGGMAAEDIVKHLTTSGPATGPFGKQAAPPSSARLDNALVGPDRSLADVERESGALPSIDSIARQYSGGKAPGPAATAMATRIRNNMVADKVRGQRQAERAGAATLETKKADSTMKLQQAQTARWIAETDAIETPEAKRKFAQKLATDKNLMAAMVKLQSSGLEQPAMDAAMEQLYALSVGEKIVTDQPAVEYDDNGLFGFETLGQPAITRRVPIQGAAL